MSDATVKLQHGITLQPGVRLGLIVIMACTHTSLQSSCMPLRPYYTNVLKQRSMARVSYHSYGKARILLQFCNDVCILTLSSRSPLTSHPSVSIDVRQKLCLFPCDHALQQQGAPLHNAGLLKQPTLLQTIQLLL